MSQLPRQLLGKQGEDIAANFLQKQGFKVIERNFKARYGEIDIISLDGQTLVFIEVKTRVGSEYGLPEEAVTPWKLREVVQTALYYKTLHPQLPDSLRIDVVAVELSEQGELQALRLHKSVTS